MFSHVKHLNDEFNINQFKNAVDMIVKDFIQQEFRQPHVLMLKDTGGVLTKTCIDAGACQVTLVDADYMSLKLSTDALARYEENIVALNIHPFRLPSKKDYDIVIADMFGNTIDSEGLCLILWDLNVRGIIHRFTNNKQYIIPEYGSMSARIYHVPSLSCHAQIVDDSVISLPLTTKASKTRWDTHAVQEIMDGVVPISDRQTIMETSYKSFPVSFPTHISLSPHTSNVCHHECLIVAEWVVHLYKDISVANVINMHDSMKSKRARFQVWGFQTIRMDALVDRLTTVIFKLKLKSSRTLNINLQLTDEQPSFIPTHKPSVKSLKSIIERAFASEICSS